MKFRVWHITNMPMEPFYIEVLSVKEALKILRFLKSYDLHFCKNWIKMKAHSFSGLEFFDTEDELWLEWEDEKGRDIHYYLLNYDTLRMEGV